MSDDNATCSLVEELASTYEWDDDGVVDEVCTCVENALSDDTAAIECDDICACFDEYISLDDLAVDVCDDYCIILSETSLARRESGSVGTVASAVGTPGALVAVAAAAVAIIVAATGIVLWRRHRRDHVRAPPGAARYERIVGEDASEESEPSSNCLTEMTMEMTVNANSAQLSCLAAATQGLE